MTSEGSNFLCGHPLGADPRLLPPIRLRPPEPDPTPTCGRPHSVDMK